MNWCYYFINLQQKAIFSKNWGGPEKDRFFGFFDFFIFLVFFSLFGFKVVGASSFFFFYLLLRLLFFLLFPSSLLSSFFSSSSPSMVVPLPMPQYNTSGKLSHLLSPLPLLPLLPLPLILLRSTMECLSRGRTTATRLWSSPRGSSPQGSPVLHRGQPELYF